MEDRPVGAAVSAPARSAPFLELLALTGVAVTQPVLHVFAAGAEVFLTLRTGTLELVLFVVLVALAPASALWGIEVAVGRVVGPGARRWVHLTLVAMLAAVVAVQLGKQATAVPGRLLLPLAVLAGGAFALVVARLAPARLFLRYLAVAPVAFVALFLFASPVSHLVGGGTSGAGPMADASASAPIVMVVLDELPTMSLLDGGGNIDGGVFPHLASFASDATWYRNHTTVAGTTAHAVPALLTGRWPLSHDAFPVVEDHPANLFTWLAGSHHLDVTEAVTQLCPPRLCDEPRGEAGASLRPLLGRAAEIWADVVWPRQQPVPFLAFPEADPEADARFDDFVGGLDAGDRPGLHYFHSLLPHQPWIRLPSGQGHDAPEVPDGMETGAFAGERAAAGARQRHILQTQYADRQVGRVLDRLKELGRYEESLVVVTADHGVSFRPGAPVRVLDDDTAPEILWTPLLVKAPGQSGGAVRDDAVALIDVLPTIADHLGVEIPWEVDGRSAREQRPPSGAGREVFTTDFDDLEVVDGYRARVDGDAGFAAVLRSRAVDGDGPDELRPYRHGHHGDLVGTPVAELPVRSGSAPSRVVLDRQDRFADVDLEADTLPAYVSGRVDTSEQLTVAVAVNGVVGGTATTEEVAADAGRRLWTMIHPGLLRSGENEVEVFVIEGDPGSARLIPVDAGGG
jgi:hypothetical protein